jgi:hypothetical protein
MLCHSENPEVQELTSGGCAQAESSGSYATEYLVNNAGTYSLRGRAGSTTLATLYNVHVSAGQIRVSSCLWHVVGWTAGSSVQAGSTLSVEISARDKGAVL